MKTKLTKHFTLSELTTTSAPLPNHPTPQAIINLEHICKTVLEPVRDTINKPIAVYSGYRSEQVNKAVGGVPNSQHLTGNAVDIATSDNLKLLQELIKLDQYDQLIIYLNKNTTIKFIHISLTKEKNRKKIFIKKA